MFSSHLILHSHMRAETSQILTRAHTGSHGVVGLTAEQLGGQDWVIWVLLGHGHQYGSCSGWYRLSKRGEKGRVISMAVKSPGLGVRQM